MKNILAIILTLLVLQLSSQDGYKNTVELRVGYGGADGISNIKTMSFSYAHELFGGIKIKPSFAMFQGGQTYGNLTRSIDGIDLDRQNFDVREIIDNEVETSTFRSSQWGLGFEKAINTDSNQSLHVMLGVRYGAVHDSRISNLIITSEDEIFLPVRYRKQNKFGYEIDLSYRIKVKDYLSVFANVNGITHTTLITFGVGLAVHL